MKTQPEEQKQERGSIRVDADVMALVVDEQARLRKLNNGKKPSYSEILRRMWDGYKNGRDNVAFELGMALTAADIHEAGFREAKKGLDPDVNPTDERERRYVIALLALLRNEKMPEPFRSQHLAMLDPLLGPHMPTEKGKKKRA